MGKFYGRPASEFLGIDETELWMQNAINLTCMVACFEDENHHYKKSQETAENEAGAIGQVVEEYKRSLENRG
jgi:hypothetical protein